MVSYSLGRKERLRGLKLTEELFNGSKSRSMAAFPIRMVYMKTDRNEGDPAAKMLVSVSKRHFKRAVKRNRVKRQIREAYRYNKHILSAIPQGETYLIALLWQSDDLFESKEVAASVEKLLRRLNEKIEKNNRVAKKWEGLPKY